MDKFWRRVIIASAVIITIIAITFYTQRPAATQYITAKAYYGDLADTVLATGKLDASERIDVGAQVSGQLKSLQVNAGDQVKKGQLIAEIDNLLQRNELRNARAALDEINANRLAKYALLTQAERAFWRQKKMLRAGASSQQDYEAAKTILATMRADITALNAQIIKAQIEVDKKILDLSYTRITAPMDGTVIAVVTRSGQTVNSSQSTPTIVKLARLDTMTIKVQISEADITRITPGQRVYFTTLSEPDRRYDAILRTIELAPESVMKESAPSSTSDSGSTNNAIYYNALLDVPNPQLKLRIAMTVQVTLILAEVKNALLIPVQALEKVDNKGNRTVRVLDKNNHIAVRQVKTGLTNNIETEITSGLSDGDIIVLAENTEISSTEDNFP